MVTSTPRYGYPIIEPDDLIRTASSQAKLADDINRMSIRAEIVSAILEGRSEGATAASREAKEVAFDAHDIAAASARGLQQQDPRIRALESLGGLAPGGVSDATVSSLIAQLDSQTTIELMSQYQRREWAQATPGQYGAVGDGVTDDTAAIRAFIQAGHTAFDGGTYRVTETIEHTAEGAQYRGNGTTIILKPKPGTRGSFLELTGNDITVDGFVIDGLRSSLYEVDDGDGHPFYGIFIDGNFATVSNNTIRNFFAANDTRAIRCDGLGGYNIHGNTVYNVGATGAGSANAGAAVSRGIQLHTPGDMQYWSHISGNHIQHIVGRGSAGIATLTYDGGDFPHRNSLLHVTGNTLMDIERRGIKVQGSHTYISSNTFIDVNTGHTDHAVSGIDFQNSNHVSAIGNIFNIQKNNGIQVLASATEGGVSNIHIKGNSIRLRQASNVWGIYLTNTHHPTITGNTVFNGGGGIGLNRCQYGIVDSNVINDQLPAGHGLWAPYTTEHTVFSNNVDNTPEREDEAFHFDNPTISNVNNTFAGEIT